MNMPPDYLIVFMQSIESMTIKIYEEFPKLNDNDVEWVYDQLMKFYKSRISNKNAKEPLSSIERRQSLVDEILNIIDVREEMDTDAPNINNPSITHGGSMIPNLEMLYVSAFKSLRNSARFWRKEHGKTGYLTYIKNFI